MVGPQSISSSLNERKLLGGQDILQIKRKEVMRQTTKITKGKHNIDASGQLIHNQATS
jgi:hypothetical protein